MALIKKYSIEHIDCEKCSQNIIDQINNLEGINSVTIDYQSNQIIVKSEKIIEDNKIYQIIDQVKTKHLFHIGDYQEKILYFDNVDCASCASKIEAAIAKEKGIKEIKLNFINHSINVIYEKDLDVENLITKVGNLVEDGFVLVEKEHHHENHSSCSIHHHHDHEHGECEDEHCHCHDEEAKEENIKKTYNKINYKLIFNSLAILLAIIASVFQFIDQFYYARLILFLISYFILARKLIINTYHSFKRKDFFNENTLMLVASIGALLIDEGFEGIMVVLLDAIGDYYKTKATSSSKKAIEDLISLDNEVVTLKDGKEVLVEELEIGQRYVIKVGDKIPVDSILISSEGLLDMKSLTGESLPIEIKKDEIVLSGSINLLKVIELEVVKKYSESTISKVKKMIEKANDKKSKSQEFITKFARVYTPIIMIIALFLWIVQYFILKESLYASLNNAFSILVIACPCALVISIPLCYFSGIGRASKEGILVKGGNYLEALVKIDQVVFDKTGTLTKGNFEILEIKSDKINNEELLKIAASCEMYSTHPIAKAIVKAYGKQIDLDGNFDIEEITGKGVKYDDGVNTILVGNDKLMKDYHIDYKVNQTIGSVLYVSKNHEFLGSIVVGDKIKDEARVLIDYLNKNHINSSMLTGDEERIAESIANELEIKTFYSKLLPNEKYLELEKIIKNKKASVVYVGDGINDSPSLRLADVGVSFGNYGADIAKEASDVVIMNDDISKLINLIKISKKTRKVIVVNISIILLVKLMAIIIGASGILGSYSMLLSIFSDVGVSLISILNSRTIFK